MTKQAADDRPLFATLAAITVVTAIVSSLGAPLVPSITARYDVPLSTAQWVLTAPFITAAAVTPVLGRWGSGRLRRPVLLAGLSVVLAGVVLAAIPMSIGTLIAGRTLQGVGLALTPLTLAVARDVWTADRLTSRLSLLSIATVSGAGLGYPITGLIAQYWGISGAYCFGSALVMLTLLLASRFLPRQAHGEPQQVDLPSVILISIGMVATLLAVSQGELWGWTSLAVLGPAAGGLLLLAGWIVRTRRLAATGGQPLVDLRLATRAGVLGPNIVSFAIAVGMYGLLTLIVLLVRNDSSAGWGLGLGPAEAGLVLVPYSLLSVTGSRLALRLARRRGPHLLLPLGSTVFASAMVLLAVRHDSYPEALLAMAIGGMGSGFTFSSLPSLIVPHVPQAETGSALAFNQLLRYLGFSVGSAVTVALLDVYGGDLAAFRTTALTMAAVCLLAAVGVTRRRPRAGVEGP